MSVLSLRVYLGSCVRFCFVRELLCFIVLNPLQDCCQDLGPENKVQIVLCCSRVADWDPHRFAGYRILNLLEPDHTLVENIHSLLKSYAKTMFS